MSWQDVEPLPGEDVDGLKLGRWCHGAGSVILVACRRTSRFHIRIDMSVAVRMPAAEVIYVATLNRSLGKTYDAKSVCYVCCAADQFPNQRCGIVMQHSVATQRECR